MTNPINLDRNTPKTGILPFAPGDLDRSGIRLTRAEFSRFLEVSKQAVTDWIKSGKVVLGADGRLDPRQAVSQLLRNSDPARLRSKVLAPLVKDVGKFQQRIADLEKQLAASKENESFVEESFAEISAVIDNLVIRLRSEWHLLRELDPPTALAAISAWIEEAIQHGPDSVLKILICACQDDERETAIPGAPENMEGAEGDHPDLDEMLRQAAEALEGIE